MGVNMEIIVSFAGKVVYVAYTALVRAGVRGQ